jgi:hypothetical protein
MWKFILTNTLWFAAFSIAARKIIFDEFSGQIIIGAFIGGVIISALFYSLGFKLLKKTAEKLGKTIPEVSLQADEKLVLETGASHYKGIEAVGGKLTLTSKRLIFRSHKFNIQNHRQEFLISEIKAAAHDERKNKIFKLELASNESHRFLVDSPVDWINTLSRS